MCAARIVMHAWSENYKSLLILAKVEIWLLRFYIDDFRQATSCLKMGMRFDITKNEFCYKEEWEVEDKREGKSSMKRMSEVCLEAMNSINPDLKFTLETAEDYEDGKHPTLDFSYWQEEGKILHEYYEKSMKTPLVIMKRSAMCQKQKISILTNELIRRLSNISESLPDTVRVKVIDKFTCQMKNSGYDRMEIIEVVMSALRDFKRKVERRKVAG